MCTTQRVNGVKTFVFRNARMAILMEPSCFLTDEFRCDAENTANQAVSAIKVLECFCSIVETPFAAFDGTYARAFMQFLRGTLSEGVDYRFELITRRSEGTVGAYLKHIRKYATWLHADNSPFLQSKTKLLGPTYGFQEWQPETHRLKADIVSASEAPRYISLDEYRSILRVVDGEWTIEERCIIRLMFEHGLRIGEVLGLTTEDLSWTKARDGTQRYSVILRNRASDKADQHAKMLMRVTSPEQYGTADYKRRNYGYQQVYISENLFFQIAEYAEGAFPESQDTSCSNLADCVAGGEENHYLFVNTKRRPLSSNLWNKRLRRIMTDAGVHVDKEARRTNLNHRFRHGYAMFLTHTAKKNGQPLDDFTVMTLMRHRSIASTEIYQRPTQEDVARMQEEIIGSFEGELYGNG